MFFSKKKREEKKRKQETALQRTTIQGGHFQADLKSGASEKKQATFPVEKSSLEVRGNWSLPVHDDIRNLLWVENGKRKNYQRNSNHEIIELTHGIRLIFYHADEPSLINIVYPIEFASNASLVERTPYFPSYKDLTPKQRGEYWRFLENPYKENVDQGYLFLLYYGLERHLLEGDIENAFNVILKLREVHKGKSFLKYSASAIVLTCLLKQRADLQSRFMGTLFELEDHCITADILLFAKYGMGLPVTATDILFSANALDFKKNGYIKKEPRIFLEMLENNMSKALKSKDLYLNKFLANVQNRKALYKPKQLYANISIIGETIEIPCFTESFEFKRLAHNLLEETHEGVKARLAAEKKSDTPLAGDKEKKPAPQPKVVYSINHDEVLQLAEEMSKPRPSALRGLASEQLFDYYYEKYQTAHKLEKEGEILDALKIYFHILSLRPQGTVYYERPCIILEKIKEYDIAIGICDMAIREIESEYFNADTHDFLHRKERLQRKRQATHNTERK